MNTARRFLALSFLIALMWTVPALSQERPPEKTNPADTTIPRASLNRDYLTYTPNTNGVTAPKVIYSPDPVYTEAARKARVQGSVMLQIVVDWNGAVKDPKVIRSLDPGLDQEAIEAVQSWKFEPAKRNGMPVQVKVNLEVLFRLK